MPPKTRILRSAKGGLGHADAVDENCHFWTFWRLKRETMEQDRQKGGGCVGGIFHPIMSLGHADARYSTVGWTSRPTQNVKCKNVAHFQGETLGLSGFPPQSAPSTGKLHSSVFGLGPGFLFSAKGRSRPKWPKIPVLCDFPPLGVRSAKP